MIKRQYIQPRAEKLQFDYNSIILTSGANHGDRGHGVGKGGGCNKVPGHLGPDNNPKSAHPIFGGC